MPTPSTPPFESQYPELKLPEHGFQSAIPGHLLNGQDEQFEWLMHEVSKNTAATEFACRGVVDLSQHLRSLNGKTYRNEKGLGEAKADLDSLKDQASVVTPFIKPLSMFATLWEWWPFKVIFVGGIIFFLGILYPYFLHSPFVEWLDSTLKAK